MPLFIRELCISALGAAARNDAAEGAKREPVEQSLYKVALFSHFYGLAVVAVAVARMRDDDNEHHHHHHHQKTQTT